MMQYEDMFAIGYGSYDFLKPTSGLICIFSLANPTYPEYTFTTDAGVLSVDFHPQHANLLAAGLYDGTVLVLDVARKHGQLIYKSTVESGTHSEPVWQVCVGNIAMYHQCVCMHVAICCGYSLPVAAAFRVSHCSATCSASCPDFVQVCWEKADAQKALQFYSVSSDGKVLLWALSKSVLVPEVAMSLRLDSTEDDTAHALAGGCCFDFNKVR